MQCACNACAHLVGVHVPEEVQRLVVVAREAALVARHVGAERLVAAIRAAGRQQQLALGGLLRAAALVC